MLKCDLVECMFLEICHKEFCDMLKLGLIFEYPFMGKCLISFVGLDALLFGHLHLSSGSFLHRRL